MKTKTGTILITENVFKTNRTEEQKEEFNKCYEKYINFCEKRFVTVA